MAEAKAQPRFFKVVSVIRRERTARGKDARMRYDRRRDDYYAPAPRLYVSPEGEGVLEQLTARWGRPVKGYRTLLPYILHELDLPLSTPVRWSQRAGCSCGCSPGFVLPQLLSPCELGWDAFATVAASGVAPEVTAGW